MTYLKYILGEGFNKGINLVILFILANSLPAEEYALFSYWEAVFFILLVVINFGQDAILLKEEVSDEKKVSHNISISRFVSGIFFLLVAIPIFIYYQYNGLTDNILLILVVSAALQTNIIFSLTLHQARGRVNEYIIFQFAFVLFQALLTIAFLRFYGELYDSRFMAIMLAAITFNFVIFGANLRNYFRPNIPNSKFTIDRIRRGFPLFLNNMAFYARSRLDKIFLFTLLPLETYVTYAFSSHLAFILPLVFVSIYRAETRRIYLRLNEGKSVTLFSNATLTCYSGLAALLVALFIIPDNLLTKVVPNIQNFKYFLALCMLSHLFHPIYLFFHSLNVYFDLSQSLIKASSAMLISYVLLCCPLIVGIFPATIEYLIFCSILSQLLSVFVLYRGYERLGHEFST